MSDSPVLLPPCPFCKGPPSPIVAKADYPYGGAPLQDDYGDDGLDVETYVFCHECGADGPKSTLTIYDRKDWFVAERTGVDNWVRRDDRHLDLYQGGEPEGLNLYPRPGAVHG